MYRCHAAVMCHTAPFHIRRLEPGPINDRIIKCIIIFVIYIFAVLLFWNCIVNLRISHFYTFFLLRFCSRVVYTDIFKPTDMCEIRVLDLRQSVFSLCSSLMELPPFQLLIFEIIIAQFSSRDQLNLAANLTGIAFVLSNCLFVILQIIKCF